MQKLLGHYKSTIGGAVLAGLQVLAAMEHLDSAGPRELALRFGIAVLTFIFGLWAHDPPKPNV